jgi:hypothetical protein
MSVLPNAIDFKNFDKIFFTEVGLTMGQGWFLNFLGALMTL